MSLNEPADEDPELVLAVAGPAARRLTRGMVERSLRELIFEGASMRIHVFSALVLAASMASGCDPKADSDPDRAAFGEAALAEAGPGATMLAVCGPFAPAGEGAGEKYIAFVERADETLFVKAPFVLVANPPAPVDPDLVAVDQEGRAIETSSRVMNAVVRERMTSPGQSRFTALVWRVDDRGAPATEDREIYEVKRSPTGHVATATVRIGDTTSEYTAQCEWGG